MKTKYYYFAYVTVSYDRGSEYMRLKLGKDIETIRDLFEDLSAYKNDCICFHDVFELLPYTVKSENDPALIIDNYKKLIDNNNTVLFAKSPQCDSTYIDKQMKATGLSGWNNFEKLLKLSIENYKDIQNIELYIRTKHVRTALKNGHKLGNKKGAKLETKKSLEMKKLIKKYCKDFGGNMNDVDVCEKINIARNTYFKYKKELKEETHIEGK